MSDLLDTAPPRDDITDAWFRNQIRQTALQHRPVPHATLDPAFPPAIFTALKDALPPDDAYAEARGTARFQRQCLQLTGVEADRRDIFFSPTTAARRGLAPLWANLATWMQSREMRDLLIDRFVPEDLHPKDRTPYHTDLRLVRETGGVFIAPHLDQPRKLLVIVIYLSDSPASAGTSLLEPAAAGGGFTELCKVPFTPNTAFVLPRTERAWHGVAAQRLQAPRNTLHLYVQRRDP